VSRQVLRSTSLDLEIPAAKVDHPAKPWVKESSWMDEEFAVASSSNERLIGDGRTH
jgi:hypothetical protein